MSKSIERRWVGRFVVVITMVAVSVMTAGTAASAAPAPLLPLSPDMVSADGLPTVQIDGVVWSQAVVGNTVYAGGKFNNARPAGAAAGTNLTPRGNLLAYDITTGNLITSFAPTLTGRCSAWPPRRTDSRIYVVGDFTTANGQARRRVAAYSTATGALITSSTPSVSARRLVPSWRRTTPCTSAAASKARAPARSPAATWRPSAPLTARC